mmetsp:Transcript_20251/g.30097  ORF Transcript_20251/g.30097 Transcript_20251/m.30097 type:complete len:276 (-) Transcript_20251:34-861(-)
MSAAKSKKNQIVRYKKGKEHFEALTNTGAVGKFRKGLLGWDKVLFADEVFTDVSRGTRPTDDQLESTFGTTDSTTCLKEIIEKGELLLSAAERKEKVENKKNKVLNYLHKYYIDPKSNLPHPITRLENALVELKVRIDPDQSVEKQVTQIIKNMPAVLPIKKSIMRASITIPHKYTGACHGIIHQHAKVEKENWLADGCCMSIACAPGDYTVLVSSLTKVTSGDFTLEVDSPQNADSAASSSSNSGRKRGGKKKKRGGGRGRRGRGGRGRGGRGK